MIILLMSLDVEVFNRCGVVIKIHAIIFINITKNNHNNYYIITTKFFHLYNKYSGVKKYIQIITSKILNFSVIFDIKLKKEVQKAYYNYFTYKLKLFLSNSPTVTVDQQLYVSQNEAFSLHAMAAC